RNVLMCTLFMWTAEATAQWIRYPTPGIPRLSDGTPDLSAPAPRTADGRPDLSGIWMMLPDILFAPIEGMPAARAFGNIGVSLPGGLPYRSWPAEAVKANRADDRVMDPLTACLPIGIVRSHTAPMYRQIVQVSGRIVILNEYNATFRQIFTDDRPLP